MRSIDWVLDALMVGLDLLSGDLERAVRLFRRSFLTDSGQWMAMVSAGDALKQLGKYHEAEEILSRYIIYVSSNAIQIIQSMSNYFISSFILINYHCI